MLILLRHGQTTSNVDRKLDTLVPGAPLTALGEEQALAAGQAISASYQVDRVFSSEALRARQTAAIAFSSLVSDIPALPGLQEIHAGRWEMHNSWAAHEAYLNAFRGFYRRDLAATVEDGDSLDTFLTRYRAGVLAALDPAQSSAGSSTGSSTDSTVVVSHGGAIRAFTANACQVDPQFAEQSYLPNCEYVVLNPGDDPAATFGDWEVVRWGAYDLAGLRG
ncbi:histidine phosphatase family protein [Corynebacterium sp. MSK041]|uniref:histidine phosphatase family protein n=1 Tax=Corynebacterium sp. MSK041 TaxID=3050194 RepID=UPI00254C7F2B|nr:histidine phosphatase family protein [Corynebacterium sp. MSK041]MDK8795982.1 histidine phosphatase family protein [Corynebacterium sp. MSK041]